MICDVCGRQNADNLTFCQDCGRRLRQHRGVAPTPPNGMPQVDLAARLAQAEPSPDESNRGSSPSGPPSAGRRARPAAPVFSFAPQAATEPSPAPARPPRPTPPPLTQPSPLPAASAEPAASASPLVHVPLVHGPPAVVCSECQSPNPPEYRFCVTCGASLARGVKPQPVKTPTSPPAVAPPLPEPVAYVPPMPPVPYATPPFDGDQIVGAPVVDIAASGSVPAKIVTCLRCHGHCVSGTRFCKYCGAPLDETPRPTAAPAWNNGASEGGGKVPLPPISRAHEGAALRPAVASLPPVSSGVRPALNPPTPLPTPVAQALAPIHMEAPRPQPVAAAASPQPQPVAVPPPLPREARAAPIADARAPTPPMALVHASAHGGEDAPRAAPEGTFGKQRIIRNAPPTPLPPRIENARDIPGVRSEISALAGSPVPSAPLIPSPPPPRDPARSAAVHAPPAPPVPPAPPSVPIYTASPGPPAPELRAPFGQAHPPRSAEPGTGAHAASPPARGMPGRAKGGGRLVVIVEDGTEGRSFSLADGHLDIGRSDGDIVLEDDPYVSPRHARLRRTDQGQGQGQAQGQPASSWTLRDLDSTNRVYVRLRKPHPLRDGDLLLLGLEVLQFQTVSDGERGLGHAIQHGTYLFGSPATPRRARLCQRTVEGVIRDVYHLFRDETVIGREAGDIVFTADPFLSRRHASIRRNPVTSEFALVDLDSSNGTYVAIRGEVAITDGDFLRIGQHLFRVDLG